MTNLAAAPLAMGPWLRAVILCGFVAFVSLPAAQAQGGKLATSPASASAIPGATSPAVIYFDPTATVEALDSYVSGGLGTVDGPFVGTDINGLLGAGTFYAQGLTGTHAAIANIEAGHVWSGHETLTSVIQMTNDPLALNEFDRHATEAGMIMAGRPGGATPGPYQQGMAPGAQLYSGALAAQWNGGRTTNSFTFFVSTMFDQYRQAFETGMDAGGRRADVINSSLSGGADFIGAGVVAMGIDGLANANPRTLFVVSAGNSGPGPNHVQSPGSGYNHITVAASAPDPTYNAPAFFTSGGPNDYADPPHGVIPQVRQVVDIAAPGQQLSSAYYGGTTGGNGTTDNPDINGPGPIGPADGPAGSANSYTLGLLGTSFSAPTVAGGAALLYDAAYSALANNADARDARVIKAVLMNSADKTVGWNNGQTPSPNGGVITTQGLDNLVGTGVMNLDKAYHQFLDGTTDVAGLASGNLGPIDKQGWDFGKVSDVVTNDYFFKQPLTAGSTFTATLTWFRDRLVDAENSAFDNSYDDLDLELWRVVAGVPTDMISESISSYNNSEHFAFALSATDEYALRVRWAGELFDLVNDADEETYGLAWSVVAVPEPATMGLMGLASVGLLIVARRRPRSNSRATRPACG